MVKLPAICGILWHARERVPSTTLLTLSSDCKISYIAIMPSFLKRHSLDSLALPSEANYANCAARLHLHLHTSPPSLWYPSDTKSLNLSRANTQYSFTHMPVSCRSSPSFSRPLLSQYPPASRHTSTLFTATIQHCAVQSSRMIGAPQQG